MLPNPICSRSLFALALIAAGAIPTFAARTGKDARHDVSQPLAKMALAFKAKSAPDKEREDAFPAGKDIINSKSDPVAAPFTRALSGVTSNGSFDGQSALDNRRILGFAYVPPDTNGAVGDKQYVQMVNVTIAVYDKATGVAQLGPAPIHTIWNGFGGPCELEDDGGDPVVLYDQLAKRWLVSQFMFNSSFTENEQCVAISTTSDATGSYYRYQFNWGANFPDYPKFGVWPDAYYNTVNVFGPRSFLGAQACAFDRAAMLSGAVAKYYCTNPMPSVASLLPSSVDGTVLPPTGASNYNLALVDDTHLGLWRFHFDPVNPGASSFTGPQLIEVANYSMICARAVNVSCIPQPATGEHLDGLADRLMFRVAYRNFGTYESLVLNHTVKAGDLAGVRWYEIRNPSSDTKLSQQGTFSDPNVNYWLASIAQDKAGNIAVGFSAASKSVYPSVYFAGRAPTDSLGTMGGPSTMVDGTGAQVSSYHRWGDYSAMTIDPTDDCTFWYTQEYYSTTSSFNWKTRIGSFKFDTCKKGK